MIDDGSRPDNTVSSMNDEIHYKVLSKRDHRIGQQIEFLRFAYERQQRGIYWAESLAWLKERQPQMTRAALEKQVMRNYLPFLRKRGQRYWHPYVRERWAEATDV